MKDLSVIHITIEKYNENWTVYYLWKSPELEWLLIEADSIDELEEKAGWVITAYVEAMEEIEEKKRNNFVKNLNIFYNREQRLTLA